VDQQISIRLLLQSKHLQYCVTRSNNEICNVSGFVTILNPVFDTSPSIFYFDDSVPRAPIAVWAVNFFSNMQPLKM